MVMSDGDVHKIIDKLAKLRALTRARERVRQLERELYSGSSRPEQPRAVPEFLSQREPLRVV